MNDCAELRDARPADYPAIVQLNQESESFLSPLPLARLEVLAAQAWYHRVACREGRIAAFLLALGPGAAYDSPNYAWFSRHRTGFVYIDRIVVAHGARKLRLASALYADLIARAREAGVARVNCEFDIDPPNEASRRFHEALGFVPVGSQTVGDGTKRVSLQELLLHF